MKFNHLWILGRGGGAEPAALSSPPRSIWIVSATEQRRQQKWDGPKRSWNCGIFVLIYSPKRLWNDGIFVLISSPKRSWSDGILSLIYGL